MGDYGRPKGRGRGADEGKITSVAGGAADVQLKLRHTTLVPVFEPGPWQGAAGVNWVPGRPDSQD